MTTRVLICDDSSVARKQMARTLPSDWEIEVSFAKHGEEALAAIKEGLGDIMFLDLNMPVMETPAPRSRNNAARGAPNTILRTARKGEGL